MRLDIYLQETRRLAEKHSALLDEVNQRLINQESLSNLEQAGALHALQVLIENAIGKAKHSLKNIGKTVPVSAYDAFAALAENKIIDDLESWNAIIGLRNKIVPDWSGAYLIVKCHRERQRGDLQPGRSLTGKEIATSQAPRKDSLAALSKSH